MAIERNTTQLGSLPLTSFAYYNEHDPFAAAWLRELIKDNLIAPGEVDERSIEDVTPDDIRSFRQCHFFAGIGVWSLAARRVGIPDDAPLWSGSCPCQPFSAAGKGGGFADERHLWPAFHYLIEQCRPPLIVGEQVAGADGDAWFDLVSADLDAAAYAFGVAETCAAGFGAPHIRTRNYWVADDNGDGQRAARDAGRDEPERNAQSGDTIQRMADDFLQQRPNGQPIFRVGYDAGGRLKGSTEIAGFYGAGGVADRDKRGCEISGLSGEQGDRGGQFVLTRGREASRDDAVAGRRDGFPHIGRPGPTNGYWRDADWLRCRDEKWRPVESGTFPLVDAGTFRNRVGLLRGAGNAITLGQAEGFLRAVLYSLER